MHLVASKYDKKVDETATKQTENLPFKHGIILSLVAIIIMTITSGSISSANSLKQAKTEKEVLSESLQQVTPTSTEKEVEAPTPPEPEIKKVELELVKKDFYVADMMAGEFEDQITLELKFKNKTEKNIKGVQGVITFYDIFDSEIMPTNISYDEGITANGEKIWKAGVAYNQFMDEHEKLKNTTLENLKYKWVVKTIVYEDNTKESFE
jgi:hypothetical protein